MNEITEFGIPLTTLEQIVAIFSKQPNIEWVKLYGSRAMGTFEKGSDIDLSFLSKGPDITGPLLITLDELPTPYKFDLTNYSLIQNIALKDHI